jgi:hypothetical protein
MPWRRLEVNSNDESGVCTTGVGLLKVSLFYVGKHLHKYTFDQNRVEIVKLFWSYENLLSYEMCLSDLEQQAQETRQETISDVAIECLSDCISKEAQGTCEMRSCGKIFLTSAEQRVHMNTCETEF